MTNEARHTPYSPGPWQMATSCSFRRIIDANGREIIGGTVQRSDGHPDLHFTNGGYEGPDARLVLAAPLLLEALEHFAKLPLEEFGLESKSDDRPITGFNSWNLTVGHIRRARAAISSATKVQE